MGANSVINNDTGPAFTVKSNGITILGRTRVYNTYTDMINDKVPSKFAWCIDASGDSTVNQGAAFYIRKGNAWQKLYESEAMDTDLIFTPENYQELIETVNNIKNIVESGSDSTVVINHINDSSIHVSAYDRELWNSVSNKVNAEEGKGLSSNDFTDTYKQILDSGDIGNSYDDTEVRQAIANTNERIDQTNTILATFISEQIAWKAELEEDLQTLLSI